MATSSAAARAAGAPPFSSSDAGEPAQERQPAPPGLLAEDHAAVLVDAPECTAVKPASSTASSTWRMSPSEWKTGARPASTTIAATPRERGDRVTDGEVGRDERALGAAPGPRRRRRPRRRTPARAPRRPRRARARCSRASVRLSGSRTVAAMARAMPRRPDDRPQRTGHGPHDGDALLGEQARGLRGPGGLGRHEGEVEPGIGRRRGPAGRRGRADAGAIRARSGSGSHVTPASGRRAPAPSSASVSSVGVSSVGGGPAAGRVRMRHTLSRVGTRTK